MSNDNKTLNTILYGPPGTGKTYSAVEKAVRIINPSMDKNANRITVMKEYKRLVENGQIKFCTFHQSYGYEEFVEGLRIGKDNQISHCDGIFKKICEDAKANNRLNRDYYEDALINNANFYKMPLGDLDKDHTIYEFCKDNNIVATWGGSIEVDYKDCNDKESLKKKYLDKASKNKDGTEKDEIFQRNEIESIYTFLKEMRKDDIILIEQNQKIVAIAKILGEYQYDESIGIKFKHFRKVEFIRKDLNSMRIEKYDYTICEIKEKAKYYDALKAKDLDATKNYVLIIDEINRGNISKIFGELITLIEEDKRLGGENELTVTLPHSHEIFGVPNNLHIIGTMNTADRSIALLDTALRRRFKFEEMMPDCDKLTKMVDGIDVKKMVETINKRIEFLYDREHTIGHSYFMKAETAEELLDMMTCKILPLLQEYFYDECDKIKAVLGDSSDDFFESVLLEANELFGKQIKGISKKQVLRLKEKRSVTAASVLKKIMDKKQHG